MALRIISLLIFGLWITKTALDTPSESEPPAQPFKTRLITALTTKIEIPLVIWIIFNFLSTIFSQNFYISVIGAYDRWEGIITVVNYGFLFYYVSKLIQEKWQLKWILFAIIFPIVISSIYGVFQSLNIDFMPWSVDPSRRVFACINNPVHFCPYVGMALPFGLAWILYLSEKKVLSSIYHTAVNWVAYVAGAIVFSVTSTILYKDSLTTIISNTIGDFLGAPKIASAMIITVTTWIVLGILPILSRKASSYPFFNSKPLRVEALNIFGTGMLYLITLYNIIILNAPDERAFSLWIIGLAIISVPSLLKATYKTQYTKHVIPVAIIAATWVLSMYIPIDAAPLSILSIIGWIIACISGKETFPSRKSIPYWGAFGVFLIIVNMMVDISQANLFILIAHLLLYFSLAPSPNWESVVKRGLFSLLTIIYYAQFISFARATWIGFVTVMPIFYMIANHSYDNRNLKEFLIDIFTTLLTIFALVLGLIFNYNEKSAIIATIIYTIVTIGVINMIRVALHKANQRLSPFLLKEFAVAIPLIIITFVVNLQPLPYYLWIPAYIILATVFLYVSKKCSPATKLIINRLCILLLFIKVQFISLTIINIIIYFVLIAGYALTETKSVENPEKSKWLLIFLIIFGVIVAAPTIPYHINTTILKQESQEILAVSNAKKRVQIYAKDALAGTARTSMWQSSFPWIKDYWLIGSGLDTIKYMYPQYRRPEYGILEGGHNFTPDRLHNEYLNTLATKGVPSFLIYYGWLIGLSIVIVLKSIFRRGFHPINHIRAGLLAGIGIYLVQVLFNFGVVATMILFYVLLGLSVAISKRQFED